MRLLAASVDDQRSHPVFWYFFVQLRILCYRQVTNYIEAGNMKQQVSVRFSKAMTMRSSLHGFKSSQKNPAQRLELKR